MHHRPQTNFRYLHIPKTGTSILIAMRNYLSSCSVKDYACPGTQGGMGNPLLTEKQESLLTHSEVQCNGDLLACDG